MEIVRKEKIKSIVKKAIFVALFFFACYIILQFLNGDKINIANLFTSIKQIIIDFFKNPKNYIALICTYWFIYGITNRTRLSCTIVASLFFCLKIKDVELKINLMCAIALFIIMMFFLWTFLKFDDKRQLKSIQKRTVTSMIGFIGLICIFAPYLKNIL